MNRVATIILNRNLPEITDALVEHLQKYDGHLTDIFVLEAGSDPDALSRYCTWHADWEEANMAGLRYGRGMNYALSRLHAQGAFARYEAFFLLTNDTELMHGPTVQPLLDTLERHSRVGILAPCSRLWGERFFLGETSTRYFWFVNHNAYFLRREFIEDIGNLEESDSMHFLFDGSNFRGWGTEMELIAKGYVNNWATAITSSAWAEENEAHLMRHAHLIKTEPYSENLKLYLAEGAAWMKKKYGFKSRWAMQQYVKMWYDMFFELYPELIDYKI